MGLFKDLFVSRILNLQVATLGLFPRLFSLWAGSGWAGAWLIASEDGVEGSFVAVRRPA